MRRMYLAPKSVWLAAAQAGIFHPAVGSHYIDLAPADRVKSHDEISAHLRTKGKSASEAFHAEDGAGFDLVLISTDFHSESTEDKWHNHPSVAILPHPTFEGTDKLHQHIGSKTKKLHKHHFDALASVPALKFSPTDTVIEFARKAAALHPRVKLRHIL